MNGTHPTYRAVLNGEKYQYIGFDHCNLFLRTNRKHAYCGFCAAALRPGEGVRFTKYKETCFACLDCARRMIITNAPRGYTVNVLLNLQACEYRQGTYSAEQVAASIRKFNCFINPNGVNVLTPIESIPT